MLLMVNDAAESFAHAQRLQVALGARQMDGFIGIAFADPDAPDTRSHNRRTSARLLQLATTNLAAAKKRPASRIYPPLFPPNEPPAVVATVVPPTAIDWERTERMVVGDPLPRGSHEPSTIRIVAVSTVFRSCGIRWTAPKRRLFSFTNY